MNSPLFTEINIFSLNNCNFSPDTTAENQGCVLQLEGQNLAQLKIFFIKFSVNFYWQKLRVAFLFLINFQKLIHHPLQPLRTFIKEKMIIFLKHV